MLSSAFRGEFNGLDLRGESFAPEHIDGVLELEKICFPAPWSRALLAREAEGQEHTWNTVFFVDGELRAFVFNWLVADEIHLLNFALHPDLHGRGLANRLMEWMLDKVREAGYRCVHLEVRESNLAAIRLYERQGFVTLYRRRGYYTDNKEDAIVMINLFGSASILENLERPEDGD